MDSITIKKNKFNWVFAVLISLVYAYILSSWPHYLFKDRKLYLGVYAADFDYYLSQMNNIKLLLFNEPLYFYANKLLGYWCTPDSTVKAIVFFNCFSVAFFCIRRFSNILVGVLFLLLLFINTQFFALQIVTLRQGLGVALMLWFYNSFKDERWRLLFIASLGLIHNSFYILFFFLFVEFILRKIKIKSITNRLLILFVVGLILNSLVLVLANTLGSKQANAYDTYDNTSSGAMFFVWLMVFLFLLFFRKSLLKDQELSNYYMLGSIGLIMYLTSYYLSPVAGRIIGTFIPFIYLSLLKKAGEKEIVLVILLICLNLYLFFTGTLEGFLNVKFDVFLDHINPI